MKPKLALSTYCLAPCSRAEAFVGTARLGYRAIEWVTFCHGRGDELATLEPGRIARELHDLGLELVALYPPPLNVHTPEARQSTRAGILRAVDWAAALACPRIVFSPLLPTAGYDYAALAEDARTIAAHIGERPIVLALENHAHWPLSTEADFRRLLALCGPDPRLALTLDTGHTTAVGEDAQALATRLAPHLAHLHLKDHRGPHCVPYGEGETDLAGVLRALEQAGYTGAATVEIELPPDTPTLAREAALRAARGWYEALDRLPAVGCPLPLGPVGQPSLRSEI